VLLFLYHGKQEARLKEWRDNKSRIDGAVKEEREERFALLRSGLSLEEVEKKLGSV